MATKGYRKKRRQTNKRKRKQSGGFSIFGIKLPTMGMTLEKAEEQKKKCTAKCQTDYEKNMAKIKKPTGSSGPPLPDAAPPGAAPLGGQPAKLPGNEPAKPPGNEPAKPLGNEPAKLPGELSDAENVSNKSNSEAATPPGAAGGRSKRKKKRKGKKTKKKQQGGKSKKKAKKGGKGGCGCSW